MLEYKFISVVLVLLCTKAFGLNYPCQPTTCLIACYPSAENCDRDQCTYRSHCLDVITPPVCPIGNPVLVNGEVYQCGGNVVCPSESFCSNAVNMSVCCWKELYDRDAMFHACPKPINTGQCTEHCRMDSDCTTNQRCCYNGCGRDCINIAGQPDTKMTRTGVCPNTPPISFDCKHHYKCLNDADCPHNNKCCHISGCGSVCRKTVTRNSNRQTRLEQPSVSQTRPEQARVPDVPRITGFQQNTGFQGDQQFAPENPRVPNRQQTPPLSNDVPDTGTFKKCAWFRVLYGGC